MKCFCLLLVLCAPLFATAYTSSQSGDCASASTWGGTGVPGAADTITITSPYTVTCSTTISIGTSVTGNVITVNSGGTLAISASGSLTFGSGPATAVSGLTVGGELVVSGTLTLQNNIHCTNASSTCLLLHGGSIIQANGTAGANNYTLNTNGNAGIGVVCDASSWASPCIIRMAPGSTTAIDFSSMASVNLSYTEASGCMFSSGSSAGCFFGFTNLTLSNVYYNGTGATVFVNLSAVNGTCNISGFHSRNTTANQAIWIQNQSGTTCTITNSTFYDLSTAQGGKVLQIDAPGIVLSNSVLVGGLALSASTAHGEIISNNLFALSDFDGTAVSSINENFWAANVYSNNMFLWPKNCNLLTGSGKCHGHLYGGTGVLTYGPSIYTDTILDGGGSGNADGNFNAMEITQRILAFNGFGSISNAGGGTTVHNAVFVLSHATANQSNYSGNFNDNIGEWELETSPTAYKWGNFSNSLATNQYYSVTQDYGSAWTGQFVSSPISMSGCTIALSAGVVTVTNCTNSLPTPSQNGDAAGPNTGAAVTFEGLTAASWLNGLTVITTSTSATGFTGWIGSAPITTYAATAETSGNGYPGFFMEHMRLYNVGMSASGTTPWTAWNSSASTTSDVHTAAGAAKKVVFLSNGNSNTGTCNALQASSVSTGTFASIAVGDMVWSNGRGPVAIVTANDGTTASLGNGTAGTSGLGAGACASGATINVNANYWASGTYGVDYGKASDSPMLNPQYRCPTCSTATWDSTLSGGNGTASDARDQIVCNMTGGMFGPSGATCTADPKATIANLQAYLRWAFTPMNGQLANAGSDKQTIGALPAFNSTLIQ